MSDRTVVFIGGPNDGERLQVSTEVQRFLQVAVQQSVVYDRGALATSGDFETFTYQLLDAHWHPGVTYATPADWPCWKVTARITVGAEVRAPDSEPERMAWAAVRRSAKIERNADILPETRLTRWGVIPGTAQRQLTVWAWVRER